MNYRASLAILSLCTLAHAAVAQSPTWSQPQKPFLVYGDTYYVGTKGLTAVLITSRDGHVLIDGTVPEGASIIADNIRALGFRVEDVKLILNTHVHFDHAGGIADLQRRSGAQVAASAASAKVLKSGEADSDDPQFGRLPKIATVKDLRVFKDGESLKVGKLALTAHLTPGHTPGGTSWTWRSCEGERCVSVAYADSLNPIAAPGYLYTDPARKPNGVQLLEGSFAVVSALPCDILLVPHPELVDLLGKQAKREQGATSNPFIDGAACRNYVLASRDRLSRRIAEEQKR